MIENLYYNKNFDLNEAIDFVFSSDNPVHQGLIISKLNQDMYNPQLIDEFRKYIKKNVFELSFLSNNIKTVIFKRLINLKTSSNLRRINIFLHLKNI